MSLAEEYAAHGIDPDAIKYHPFDRCVGPGTLCPYCRLHAVSQPTALCDLQQAKAAEITAHGGHAVYCFSCHAAYESEASYGRCPECQVAYDAAIETARREAGRYDNRPQLRRNVVYRPDGFGCVERVSLYELALEHRDYMNGPGGLRW